MGALPPMHKPLSDPEHIASILCSGKGGQVHGGTPTVEGAHLGEMVAGA